MTGRRRAAWAGLLIAALLAAASQPAGAQQWVYAPITINGVICSPGGSCTITAAASGLVVGTTTIGSGTTKGLLYDNAGVLGNLATGNNGVLVTGATGIPSISSTLPSGIAATNMALTTPSLGAATATSINKWTFTAPATSATLTAGGDGLTYTFPAASKTLMASDYSNGASLGAANALLTSNGAGIPNAVAITGLVLGNGASAPTAYGGTSAPTNQFMTALSAAGVGSFLQPAFSNLSGIAALGQGGTGADLSATGGTYYVVQQASSGAAFTVGQLGAAAISGLGSMATQSASAVAITGGTAVGLTGLGIRDTSAAYDVTIAATSSDTLTAGRTLTLDVENGARTLSLGANLTVETDPGAVSGIVKSDGAGTYTAATAADIPATALPTPGAGATLAAPRSYYVCTTTCSITLPTPAAGYEFCIWNDDNVSTVITLVGITNVYFENTARTAYGTVSTGTLQSGGAVADKVCVVGRDTTHYHTVSYNGTWTAS